MLRPPVRWEARLLDFDDVGHHWAPVWHVLNDGELTLLLANAEHVRNVPGRKTDVKDAVWLADLLAHGLVKASFVPPTEIRELRDLTRTRRQLVRQRVQHVQRIQKTLEDANIKLDSVISNIVGMSGRAILEAMVSGQSDPEKLAALASERIRATPLELKRALHGRMRDHHRTLIRLHLSQVDATDAGIAELDKEIERSLEPFRSQREQLTSIPGVGEHVARTLIAEIGVNMKQFPSAAHLVSWAGLGPGLKESAGKKAELPDSQGRSLAQARAGPGRLGRRAHERVLLPLPLPSAAEPPRPQKGHRSRRRRHPHRRLPHPHRRHFL
jgi:transposase